MTITISIQGKRERRPINFVKESDNGNWMIFEFEDGTPDENGKNEVFICHKNHYPAHTFTNDKIEISYYINTNS